MALTDLDTRALTRHLRTRGAMKGAMSTNIQEVERVRALAQSTPSTSDIDLVAQVTCDEPYAWTEGNDQQWRLHRGSAQPAAGYHIVVYDCGIKRNMLRLLVGLGCRVTVVPATALASEVLAERPDGVLFSNGPGDPECVPYVVESARQLLGKTPIFGICLGQQVLGLALGGRTYKLRFGHHGGNQPVQELRSGQVAITAQNHNFVVDMDSLPPGEVEGTHINLNDRTLEGLRHKRWPLFSVQYHPEASPGPHDAESLFRQFIAMISEFKRQ
jgi:carbamoyl-phosphate synthase small subunit